MKAKFGAIVVDGRGKLGGKVFSRNRYGSYEKIKVTPTNPESAYSAQVRANYKTIVQTWSTLTDIQRASFNSGTKQFPQKNTFGDIHFLSGFGLYVSFNINRLLLSQSLLVSCPSPTTSHFIQSANVEAREIDNTVTLNFSPLCPAGYVYKINATTSLSPGINYSNRRFKLLGFINSSDTSPFDLSSLYIARFGNVGNAGQKIFFKISAIEISSGIESQPYIFSTIILNSLDMLKASVTINSSNFINGAIIPLVVNTNPTKLITVISCVQKIKPSDSPFTGTGMTVYLRFTGATGVGPLISNANIIRTTAFSSFVASVNTVAASMAGINLNLEIVGTPSGGNSEIIVDVYYILNDY